MKKNYTSNKWVFILILILSGLTFSCSNTCEEVHNYVYYQPVYSTSAAIKAAVKHEGPRELSSLGKIYFKDGYLFVNEVGSGIHIIDNRNPSDPKPISFLTIPGNFDLAIRNNTLYADSYVDLVAFDISNLQQIKEVNRIERLFNNHTTMGMMVASERGILTHWEKKENVYVNETDCHAAYQPWGGFFYSDGIAFASRSEMRANLMVAPGGGGGSATGIGGSMARFTIVGDHMYGLDGANLDIVDITTQHNPKAKGEFALSWDVETLFPYQDKLFVGSQTGMYILDLVVPDQPVQLSHYQHIRSCDPVVVEGDYAFVTLRSGTACQGFTNQLEVIDIKDLKNPKMVSIYPMTNPHGLGIDDGTLFICDGANGLLAFDATDVLTISSNQLAHYKDIQAFDIIPYQKVAMMIGSDGLYQYDYSDLSNITLLSHLPLVNE